MKCRLCGKEVVQSQGRRRSRCGSCNTKIRRLRNKLRAIKLLGGKCVRCGYNQHPAAFEFHHKTGSDKLFNIGEVANKSWPAIQAELKKCELLCANCHRIEHSDRTNPAFLVELSRYAKRTSI